MYNRTHQLDLLYKYRNSMSLVNILSAMITDSKNVNFFIEDFLCDTLGEDGFNLFLNFLNHKSKAEFLNINEPNQQSECTIISKALEIFMSIESDLNDFDFLYFLKEFKPTRDKLNNLFNEFLNLCFKFVDKKKLIETMSISLDSKAPIAQTNLIENKLKSISKKELILNPLVAIKKQEIVISKKQISDALKSTVIGQDNVCDKIACTLFPIINNFSLIDSNLPIGRMMFCGPSSSGKSLLAKTIAKEAFSNNFLLLPCEEYVDETAVNKLFGSNNGYVGFGAITPLSKFLLKLKKNKERGVLVFDEIEKMNREAQQSLLSALDGSSFEVYVKKEDVQNEYKLETLNLKNVLVIATSNLASRELENGIHKLGFQTSEPKEIDGFDIIKKAALKSRISTEFFNRFPKVFVFNSLTQKNYLDIAKLNLENTLKLIQSKFPTLKIKINNTATQYISKLAQITKNARRIQDICNDELNSLLSERVLLCDDLDATTFVVESDNNELCVTQHLIDEEGTYGTKNRHSR